MHYKAREGDRDKEALIRELEPVVKGLGFSLVELSLYRSGKKAGKSAQIRLVVASHTGIGTDELSVIHRAVLPRLGLLMEGIDLFVEVSSPGLDRLIKNGFEFSHYTGRKVKCWRKDKWETGILRGADEEKIVVETKEGIVEMKYESIAKARLDG